MARLYKPESWIPHPVLKNTPAHKPIHTKKYRRHIIMLLTEAHRLDRNKEAIIQVLREIALSIENGTIIY